MLASLGRYREAIAMHRRVLASALTKRSACSHAKALNNLGWVELLAQRSGNAKQVPIERFRSALELTEGECTDRSLRANTLVNLAAANLQAGDLARAHKAMKSARAVGTLRPFVEAWALNVEGEIALAQKNAQGARDRYNALQRHARTIASPEHQWRAQLGLARSSRLQGRIDEAITFYYAAERFAQWQSLAVAFGEGRARFLAARQASSQEMVDLLWSAGRKKEAVLAARTARRTLYAQLHRTQLLDAMNASAAWHDAVFKYRQKRAALNEKLFGYWSKSVAQKNRAERDRALQSERLTAELEASLAKLAGWIPLLNSPKTSDAFTLGFYPLPESWLVYGIFEQRLLRAVEVRFDPARATSVAPLLEPFEDLLKAHVDVRLLLHPMLERFDVHAARLGGRPIASTNRLVYALDITPARSPPDARPPLIVADPRGDLPGARDEAAIVGDRMREGGRNPVLLMGRQATRDAVLTQIEGAFRFHFAGHGRSMGFDGWSSHLVLAPPTVLSIAEVLTMTKPPHSVVLTGCETADSGERLGLAQAFLLVGTSTVIAAVRVVDDQVALRFSTTLYRTPVNNLAKAFHDAQTHLLGSEEEVDWSAFRMMVP